MRNYQYFFLKRQKMISLHCFNASPVDICFGSFTTEYQSKGDDTLRLGSKLQRQVTVRVWVAGMVAAWQAGSLAGQTCMIPYVHGPHPHLSDMISECFRDRAL